MAETWSKLSNKEDFARHIHFLLKKKTWKPFVDLFRKE